MEEYMSKTQANYGSGIARPKIDDIYHFELKGQFLKELRDYTFSGSDHEDANEHIEKQENMKKTLNLTRKFKLPNDAAPETRSLIKTLEIQQAMSNDKQERGFEVYLALLKQTRGSCLGELAHTKLTVELANRTVKHPKRIAENVLVGIGKFVFPVDFIILDMPEDVKVSLILGRPFLSTAHAKIDVFKRKITLRRMELDLEARLMGETLVLKRSLDHLYGDYIKLNNLNVPLELRRNQVDDLMLTIEEVVENMDGYRDQDMREVIFGEPFCKASCVEARRFDGIITIHNGPRWKEIDNVGDFLII
ncbi:hypothetical protein Tco_0184095 [Tanacetum coccineum]